jgi:hypothetical protein
MKTKFAIFCLVSLIVSCKNATTPSSQATLPFDGHAFSVNNFSGNSSSLRKKLLHEIYLNKKEIKQIESEKVIENDLEDIKDDSNYNKNFKKLIVSYSNREELFYIPNSFQKSEVQLALGLENKKNKSWVWKNELLIGEVAYLIETTPEEVLKNEKYFEKYLTKNLEEISPFQKIEISLQVFESKPQLQIVQQSISYLSSGEHQIHCSYVRSIPEGNYLPYTLMKLDTLETSLVIHNENTTLVFHREGQFLKANIDLQDLADVTQNFKIIFPEAPFYQFESVPSNCQKNVPNQVFDLKNRLEYKLNFTVYGTNETLESFGAI